MNKEEMSMELTESATAVMCDKILSYETATECVLPDYQPEIRKLLTVCERVLPPAKYVSGSTVECNGSVEYNVLYIGTDGGLWSASCSGEYEFSIPADGSELELSGGACVTVCTVCEGNTARVVNGRKLNIRSRMRSHVRAYAKMAADGDYGELEGNGVEILYKYAPNSSVVSATSDVIELTEEITGLGDDIRVASADGCVFVSDIRRASDSVDVGGEVLLKLILCREGRGAETVTRKIRFSGSADTEGMSPDCLCRVNGRITDIMVSVEEGKVLCNISLILDILAAKNKTWKYASDVYSTERVCENDTMRLALPMVIACSNGNFSQSERLALADSGIQESANIVDAYGNVSFDGCEYSDGKYIFTGESKYVILCEKDGEYSTSEITLPVKYEIEGEEGKSLACDAMGQVVSCRARADGETLAIDAEIAVCADVFGGNDVEYARNVRLGEEHPKRKSQIIVYYPAEGETPWEVAKKYHVPVNSLTAEKNYYLF